MKISPFTSRCRRSYPYRSLFCCLLLCRVVYGMVEGIVMDEASSLAFCPEAGTATALSDHHRGGDVLWLGSSRTLCTLYLVSNNDDTIKPVARSYLGHPWEAYGGDYAGLEINCDDGSGKAVGVSCALVLPDKPEDEYRYELASFNHSVGPADEIARFLERTTFGPTRSEIDGFPETFAEHIRLEMSKSASDDSHRRFFRERVNHRFEAPGYQGIVTRACDAGTRYRRYAFSGKDWSHWFLGYAQQPIEIRTQRVPNDKGGKTRKVFLVNGQIRTFVEAEKLSYNRTVLPGTGIEQDAAQEVEFEDGTYTMCDQPKNSDGHFWEGVGASFTLKHPTTLECGYVLFDGIELGVPLVQFDEITPPTNPAVVLDRRAVPVDTQYYHGSDISSNAVLNPQELYLEADLQDPNCALVPEITGIPPYTVTGIYHDEYWLHDPRFVLLDNSFDKNEQHLFGEEMEEVIDCGNVHGNGLSAPACPLMDGGGKLAKMTKWARFEGYHTGCSNVPMNFVNQDYCQLSYEPTTCTQLDSFRDGAELELTTENLRNIHEVTGAGLEGTRYVYAIDGLRQDGDVSTLPYHSPCTPRTKSRWIPVDGSDCSNYETVHESTQELFVELLNNAKKKSNPYTRDINFPSYEYECHVLDANKYGFAVPVEGQCWLNVHPSHLQVYDFTDWIERHPGGAQTIKQFADNESNFILTFPSSHSMDRFHGWSSAYRTELGRLGDKVKFRDLSPALATPEVADAFGSSSLYEPSGPTVVCGSPDEVANDPDMHGSFQRGAFDIATRYNVTSPPAGLDNQKMNIWMEMALHGNGQLRQRVAWALSQILVVSTDEIARDEKWTTEVFLVYYDIFIRNAFGNYFDILKEVTYSPIMARMLSYYKNTATEKTWRDHQRIEFPDENYAREIMQLFSIGLKELNNDGTPILDEDGNSKETYTNEEITEYARAWTGLDGSPKRANIEDRRTVGTSRIDPMLIDLSLRDVMPKRGLYGRYIGDGLPLCSDLPELHFLKRGATYELLGSMPHPRLHSDGKNWVLDDDVIRLSLVRDSELRRRLCDKSGGSSCRYHARVILNEDLSCTDLECEIDTPRVIEVEPGLYYEYIRPPCAYQAFYNDGRVLFPGKKKQSLLGCADSRLEAASAACCKSRKTTNFQRDNEVFLGERVRYPVAEKRCSQDGLTVCKDPVCKKGVCDSELSFWSSRGCGLLVKLNLDGTVGIVHSPRMKHDLDDIHPTVRHDTQTFFRVNWNGPIDEFLSDYAIKCTDIGGTFTPDDKLCMAPVTVIESGVFTDESPPPSREAVLKKLHFGAFEPDMNEREYVVMDLGNGVKMYSEDGSFSITSLLEVVDDFGVTRYLKNMRSTVLVGSNEDLPISFRNPTHMISLTTPELRDAFYETDATINHFFYHKNMAPFLAIRFAQRFGISNPSPRYVDVVASAFRRGLYMDESSGISFGSGKYGDMAAMIAAVLLDREATSAILDADPSHGSLLEPFLKLIRIMRSLEFESSRDWGFVDMYADIQDQIGQQPHKLPNVFSFFRPEFKPSGLVGEANLYCPECQVLSGPKVISAANGFLSLMKYGWDTAYGGFGVARRNAGDHSLRRLGDYTTFAVGHNTYAPAQDATSTEVVDELVTLLASGRLGEEKRAILRQVYEEAKSRGADTEAYINVQQLIVSTPEFHANGLSPSTDEPRSLPETPEPTGEPYREPYRSLVYLFLEGGLDSYSVLVPHSCDVKNEAGMTVDAQYNQERGIAGLLEDERDIQISVDKRWGQPCSVFAIHPKMPILKEMYDSGDLIFFANTGAINVAEGLNKSNYQEKTPSQLFAHNAMQDEMKKIDPFAQSPGTGVLGRLSTVLTERGFQTSTIGIDLESLALNSKLKSAPLPIIISRKGLTTFGERPAQEDSFDPVEFAFLLNNKTKPYSNLYGEMWASKLTVGVTEIQKMKAALDPVNVGAHWPTEGLHVTGEKLRIISKLIKASLARGIDRDMFFADQVGYDHHRFLQPRLKANLYELNEALTWFVQELKDQGIWNNVTIVIASDFARTLTPNAGLGTDHGWGGNYWMMGGSVAGGKVLGQLPSDLTSQGLLNVGRGRFIPTTSWDCIWNGLSQWMGAESSVELDRVLPNRIQSSGTGEDHFTKLFTKEDLFENGETL